MGKTKFISWVTNVSLKDVAHWIVVTIGALHAAEVGINKAVDILEYVLKVVQ